jgi:hypothetical protein
VEQWEKGGRKKMMGVNMIEVCLHCFVRLIFGNKENIRDFLKCHTPKNIKEISYSDKINACKMSSFSCIHSRYLVGHVTLQRCWRVITPNPLPILFI